MNLHKLQDIVEDRGAWHAVVHGIAKIQTRRSDETTVITLEKPRNRVIFLYIVVCVYDQSIPKEVNPEYSLEGQMLKLKPQYFGHHAKTQLTGKDPDAGKD